MSVIVPRPLSWDELHVWHNVPSIDGDFMERFTDEALAGVEPRDPIRFKVIRDEWTEDDEGRKRLIHEVEFV